MEVHVTGYGSGDPGNLLIDETFYIYRFLDVRDSNHTDGKVEMADTVNDGAGGVERIREISFLTSASAMPTIDVSGTTQFGFDSFSDNFFFDPTITANDIAITAGVIDPNGDIVLLEPSGSSRAMERCRSGSSTRRLSLTDSCQSLPAEPCVGASAAEKLLIDTPAERRGSRGCHHCARGDDCWNPFNTGWTRVTAADATSVDIDVFDTTQCADGSIALASILGNSFLVDNDSKWRRREPCCDSIQRYNEAEQVLLPVSAKR